MKQKEKKIVTDGGGNRIKRRSLLNYSGIVNGLLY